MKKLLLLLSVLLTLNVKGQEEFSRAYLNVLISYGDSIRYYEGANAFTFNVDGNSVLYYPHNGSVERFIYIGETMEGEDTAGDTYQLIKTIEVESSEIVYFQLYDNRDYGLKLIFEESLMVIHFFNKLIE